MQENIKTKAIKFVLDTLFPKFCLSCQKEGLYVCPKCLDRVPINNSFYCYLCGRRSPFGYSCKNCKTKTGSRLNGVFIASDWRSLLLRQMIYEYKYRFIKELGEALGKITIKFINENFLKTEDKEWHQKFQNSILIPVPLHKERLSWRGFNQAEILAKQISDQFNIPLVNDLIIRSLKTMPQMDIEKESERIKNIRNAFSLNPGFKSELSIKEKIFILIDDVCTTGSTLNECAKILKIFQPKEIWGLVLARG